jgi:hypothetical protein
MSDDIETLREFIGISENAQQARDALERLAGKYETAVQNRNYYAEERKKVEAERDRLQGRVGTLQQALDDRHAADLKAWKAIMQAVGRTQGLPTNKEVVAYYVAEVERLEKERDEFAAQFCELRCSRDDYRSDRDSLRAKLERAKAWLKSFKPYGWVDLLAELSADAPAQTRDRKPPARGGLSTAIRVGMEAFHGAPAPGGIHGAVLNAITAAYSVSAQQTQISDEAVRPDGFDAVASSALRKSAEIACSPAAMREVMVEAEKALEPFEREAFTYEPDEGDSDQTLWGNIMITLGDLRRARVARAKLKSVMK